ncbi:hypothetical protein H0H92_010713, partial [Tricholoma furcatifolium]
PFTVFNDKNVPKEWFRPGKPDYLYNHNSNGLQASSRTESTPQSDPLMRHQVSMLSANVQLLAQDLRSSRSDIRELSNAFTTVQERSDERFANMIFLNSFQTNLLIAQNQLSGTNSCIASTYISLSTASDPAARANIESHIAQLQETQSHQKQIVSDATQQVFCQQSLLTRIPGQDFPPIQLPHPLGLPPPQHVITPSSPSTSPPIPCTNLKHSTWL